MDKDEGRMRTKFVSRAAWGALPAKNTEHILYPVENVVYTFNLKADKCMTREDCMEYMRDTQRRHMRVLLEDDIPYNFYIGDDGTVYEGRGWYARSSKKLKYPELKGRKIDIAFIGNYTDGDRTEVISPGMDLTQYGILLKLVHKDYDLLEIPDL